MTRARKPKQPKPYSTSEESASSRVSEPIATYYVVAQSSPYATIAKVKQGVGYPYFKKVAQQSDLSLMDWAEILNLSERTMQRYEQENKTFAPIYSEKILAIDMLMRYGAEVFGSREYFHVWLETSSVALGGVAPKSLLDTSIGIDLIRGELIRIEHGVLA